MSTVFRLRRPSGATTALVALLVTSLAAPAAFPDAVGTQRIGDSFSGNAIDPNIRRFGTNRPEAVAISEAEGHVTVNISGRAGNDFDARISFELGAWPAFCGAMRLVRQGATMTGYYWLDHRWVAVFTGGVPVSDVDVNLDVFNGTDATRFEGDWATIQLDDFHLTADAITCSWQSGSKFAALWGRRARDDAGPWASNRKVEPDPHVALALGCGWLAAREFSGQIPRIGLLCLQP